MKGDNSPSIRKSDIESFLFPLPPLPEQQRIVSRIESLFAKLDAARDKLQQVLDTQEARRAAILHEAFTGRLTGHKGSAECRGKREKEGAQNKPYPLSRTVSKSRTLCFRQFNNPDTFKIDVW